MPSTNVQYPVPFLTLPPMFVGQFGVPGTGSPEGRRTDTVGATFYVNPNATGVSDLRDGTNPEAPLQTVAAALALCQPYRNDMIIVSPNNSWQYGDSTDGYTTAISEEVTITVPGVRLVGVCPSGQGVYWTPASNGGTCITVSAIDCTIEGFFFTEGDYTGLNAIYCEWDGVTLFGENLTVRNCTFDDTVDVAIQLEFSWYCDIHHNHFLECDEYGVYDAAAGSGVAYSAIHDNWFLDCGTAAIALLGGSDNNSIYNNRIYNGNAEGAAAATNEGINTTGGATNIITNNWLSCLLPVPANGDLNDFCTAAATDAWAGNWCMDGLQITQPT